MSFLRPFAALSGASFVSMAANLVRGKMAAVFLGPAGVGIYNQLTLSFNVGTLAGSLATNNGVIQHGSEALMDENKERFSELVSTMVITLAVSSILITGAALFASRWISDLLLGDHGNHWRFVALLMVAIPIAVFGTLYRGLLGAGQDVRELVRIQIVSEIGGMILFATLLFLDLALTGALLGFLSVQLLAAIASFVAIRRRFGPMQVYPSPKRFRWSILKSNLGFGASGLVMAGLSNLSLIGVNRVVIGAMGLGAAGVLANSVRLSNVYLGAVTTTALNYYLPAVSRLADPQAISAEVSKVVRFYCLLLPPIMVAIVVLAPWIVPIIFSKAFLAAVPLIAVLVPSELLRVIGESLAVPLIAKRRLVPHTALFVLQTALFVGLSSLFTPTLGLIGVALAYSASMAIYCLCALVTVRQLVGIRIDSATRWALLRALFLLAAMSAATFAFRPDFILGFGLIAVIGWLAFTLRDPSTRRAVGNVWRRA